MAIRVIALDIDGTLTNSRKEITPRTRDALLRVQEHGVRLVLSSGRPEQGLYQFAEVLDMPRHGGLLVCYNGGKVVNCGTKEVLFQRPLPVEEAQAVLRHMEAFAVEAMFDRGEYMYVRDVFRHDISMPAESGMPDPFNVMQYEARNNGFLLCEKRDLAAFADFPIYKILFYGEPGYLQKHHEAMAAPFRGRLSAMFTSPFFFEFTAGDADKAKAAEAVLMPLGYAREERMAFGDAPNDSAMLQSAGLGIAMGNADEAVKAIADEVTGTCEEDGIAFALYRHLPELFPERNG